MTSDPGCAEPEARPADGIDRRSFLRSLAVVGGLAAAPAFLAACAPDTASSTRHAPVRVGWTSEIDTLNPITAATSEAVEVWQLVYDRLFQYDLELRPEPCLAVSSTRSDGGRTITYTLRDDVRWHDGTAFSADDVAFTFEMIHSWNVGAFAANLTDLTEVTAPDRTTVVASFRSAQALDPGLIVPILPRHIWSGMTAAEVQKFANAKAVGTGPFRFDTWKRGQSVKVVRNDSWWGAKPKAAAVSWQLYGNDDVMAQALKSGDVDILCQVPPTVYDGLEGTKGITSSSLTSFSFHHIGINVDASAKSKGNPLLRDRAIRQALSCAVSRKQLVALALAGHGTPGSTLLPTAFGDWHYEVPDGERLDADVDKANRLLDEAGYARPGSGTRRAPNGAELSFRLIAIESTTVDVRAAQLFQQAAARVGIELTLSTLDSNTLSDTVYNADAPDWDIFVWGWDSQTPDPTYLLGIPLTSQIGSNNDVFYSNKTYDELYDKQAVDLDHASRLATVHEMQRQYYQDCAYIVMWYQAKLQCYRPAAWTGWKRADGGLIFNFTRDNYLDVTRGAGT